MKKQTIIIAAMAIAMPLLAQETNKLDQPNPDTAKKMAPPPEEGKRPGPTDEQKKEFRERHIKLMERVLNEIGVTEVQRAQIIALQDEHRKKMKENWMRINGARRELSRLQDSGADAQELEAAIQEVSDAQTEQLRILVRNRSEMERILGKEKNDLFMNKIRELYREHGRRPGSGMPPRPPVPGGNMSSGTPPIPSGNQSDGHGLPPTP